MITYLVQREIEGVGLSGRPGLELSAARSVEALARMAPRVTWCHTWIGADFLLSLYRADAVGDVIEHARRAGLPDGRISRVLAELPGAETSWLTSLDATGTSRG
ncbi:DUF4242 domain-containing protein [Psychromarinibacter sp. C21-152]|uniref:DUF4242 domain-containing protein n=1 Tax=Psychromarinibacter sediminicola TaxID=3033385 RepID=A0AAE3TAW9_9RHOB|nr:nickel-binding protein [Psychromarinibacter sediminicola]MDF0603682.1 DUF4242 domain-containing protein [Psychromarinibacter sediminicola]